MQTKYIIILYAILILVLHIIPTGSYALNEKEVVFFRADYLLHSLLFLPWMVLAWFHLRKKKGSKRLILTLKWFCIGLFLALFSEFIQKWIPYRSFNPVDMLYHASGVLIGTLVFLWKDRKKVTSDKVDEKQGVNNMQKTEDRKQN